MASEQELYQQYLKETGTKPSEEALYQQYLHETGASPQAAQSDTIDEMHPDIKFTDRLAVKALGNDTDSSLRYLQKQNPNLQFRNVDGDIQAKKPDEQQWRKLDPSKLDLQDIADLAWDIPAGVAQGVATAGAGLLGAPAGGVGAIPAAMAGSAASGTGLEAIRQGLGKYFGINDEVSGKDLALTAGTSALSPLLFGTGAGAKDIAKSAIKSGLDQKAIEASQRGLLGRGYDAVAGYVGPKIGSLLSGQDSKLLKTAAGMTDELKVADISPEPITQRLDDASQAVTGAIRNMSDEAGKGIENTVKTLDAQGAVIKTAPIVKPLEDAIQKLKSDGMGTESNKELIDQLQGLIDKHFKVKTEVPVELNPVQSLMVKIGAEKPPAPKVVTQMPEAINASNANQLYFDLKGLSDSAGVNFNNLGTAKGAVSGVNVNDSRTANALLKAMTEAKNSVKQLARDTDPKLGQEFDNLHSQYSILQGFKSDFQKASSSEEAFQRLLAKSNNDAPTEKLVKNLKNISGVDLPKVSREVQALRTFRKPSPDAVSIRGGTSTSRTVPLALAGGALGYYAGQNSGGEYSPYLAAAAGSFAGSKAASPAALRAIMTANRAARRAPVTAPGVAMQQWLPYIGINAAKNGNR